MPWEPERDYVLVGDDAVAGMSPLFTCGFDFELGVLEGLRLHRAEKRVVEAMLRGESVEECARKMGYSRRQVMKVLERVKRRVEASSSWEP